MEKTLKKKINRKLIKFQNQLGKGPGKVEWLRWMKENFKK
jgi:hypothetical protein